MINSNIILAFICVVLWLIICKWIHFWVSNEYIAELFTQERTNQLTSHTVDLPLTTSYSCQNFCGPTARCSITGSQCSADIDCAGCELINKEHSWNILGNNKEAFTSNELATNSAVLNNFNSPAPLADYGINTWKSSTNQAYKLFKERYIPDHIPNMPNYTKKYELSGEFITEGPLPFNY
jgi:hypothetical protein